MLLLDDVLSELDEGRKQYLLTCMKEKQTFVTSCDDTDLFEDRRRGVPHGRRGAEPGLMAWINVVSNTA